MAQAQWCGLPPSGSTNSSGAFKIQIYAPPRKMFESVVEKIVHFGEFSGEA